MIQLADITALVNFDEISHTYTRVADNKQLCGVTTMLRKVGVAQDYSGISEETLMTAADRGHCVHALCDKVDSTCSEVDEFDEINIFGELKEKGIIKYLDAPYGRSFANEYLKLRTEAGYIPVASEYLVSDGENIASSIDLVLTTEDMMKNNEVYLADIKTTSSIHEEPLGWQLSIYRDLFEAQNPGIKVVGLLGVWLPKPQYGQCKIFDATCIKSQDDVKRIINCLLDGVEYFTLPSETGEGQLIPMQSEVVAILKKMDELKKKETELKANLLEWMQANGHKKFENDEIIITRVLGGDVAKFDSTAFKKEQPEMFKQYTKVTKSSDSIRIKIK